MSTPELWSGNERVSVPSGLGYDLLTRPVLLDETVIAEVITNDCYRVRGVDMHAWTVIDCGAHVGVFSTMCASQGARRVIAVEPQPENLELLTENVRPFPCVTIVKMAIGATAGTTKIAGESGGTHVEPGHVDAIEVPMTTLATLIDLHGPHVDLCKLDMEGSEVDALLGCDHE